MSVSRRRLLIVAGSVPVVAVAGAALELASGAIAGAVRAVRPSADGTSATRCAQCGSPDHTMLDPICPLAPRVLA